ncbi:hypothetical protein H4R19_004363 [Coemansia spiralis]|nr:hypothetical protein H4R19_004363 [Coemansia spiralis]
MTPAIYALLNRYREDGLLWAEIQARFPLYPRVSGLEYLFNIQKALVAARVAAPVRRAVWSKEETRRVKEVTLQHYRPGDPSQAADVLVREFPDMARPAIMRKINKLVVAKLAQLRRDFDRMIRLVDVHGADWERIGREMDVPPSMAQQEWLKHQESTNPPPHANRPWSLGDLTQLQQLAAGYGSDPIDWLAVGKQLGRHSPACVTMYYALKRPPPARLRHRPTDPASLEVQRQLACGSSIDWEQVSQAVGLDVRQCLELSQVDEGKGRWIYEPDTFSWATAERMKAFIADNYPAPMMANFRAVSNYMWLDMDDCIRMEGVLRGAMERTDELKAQITEMRRLGMVYKDIGLRLSPCINSEMVRRLVQGPWSSPKVALPPADKQRLRAFVDAHVDKCTFQELRALIHKTVDGPNKVSTSRLIIAYAAWHPGFKAHADSFGGAWVANRLASGATIPELAVEIGVSPVQIYRLASTHEISTYSSRWTKAETAQLLGILRSSARPYRWRFIGKKMVTKCFSQCCDKYTNLRATGKLPAELL